MLLNKRVDAILAIVTDPRVTKRYQLTGVVVARGKTKRGGACLHSFALVWASLALIGTRSRLWEAGGLTLGSGLLPHSLSPLLHSLLISLPLFRPHGGVANRSFDQSHGRRVKWRQLPALVRVRSGLPVLVCAH